MSDTATTSASYLTQEAYDRLKGELDQLSGEGRTEIAKKIEAARDEGDLKENGGYHAAKEEQGKMEARIRQLTQLLETATVGEAAEDDGIVGPGMVVTVDLLGDEVDVPARQPRDRRGHRPRGLQREVPARRRHHRQEGRRRPRPTRPRTARACRSRSSRPRRTCPEPHPHAARRRPPPLPGRRPFVWPPRGRAAGAGRRARTAARLRQERPALGLDRLPLAYPSMPASPTPAADFVPADRHTGGREPRLRRLSGTRSRRWWDPQPVGAQVAALRPTLCLQLCI